jgi:hypothetical protein
MMQAEADLIEMTLHLLLGLRHPEVGVKSQKLNNLLTTNQNIHPKYSMLNRLLMKTL